MSVLNAMLRKWSGILAVPVLALATGLALRALGLTDTSSGTTASPPVPVAFGNATNGASKTLPPATALTNRLAPGPSDGRIAFVVARLLERAHYVQHPFDDDFSAKFLDRYLEMLDPQHLHFTQQDLAEFERYRTRLDDLTITRKGVGDTTPAYEIFNRFLERLAQRVAYADELLKTDPFDFTGDERVLVNRREAPYPRDLDEARRLWRERLRLEYLQEKLARIEARAKTNALAARTHPETRTATTAAEPKAESPTATTNTPAEAGASSVAVESTAPASAVPNSKPKTDAEEIAELLSKRYHRMLHMFQEWESDDVLERYLTALAHVYDPHSDYMNASGAKNFAIGMNLALFGIGAVLTTDLDGYCKIQELKPGPAMKSKQIKVGDKIIAVAQSNGPPVDIVGMNLNKAVQLIRGPKGTEVRLTIIPADNPSERRVVSLIRDEIKLEDQEVKGRLIELPGDSGKPLRLGVIDVPTFYATIDRPTESGGEGGDPQAQRPTPRSTSADVAKLLKKFREENVAGVILDLRRNGGGSLDEAIKVTGLFIKQGPVVQVRTTDGHRFVRGDEDGEVAYEGPLVVLTSRMSASASEIVAGALQDYRRAVIVGESATHGKGTVQNLNPLAPFVEAFSPGLTNDPGQLKITIQKFYRPSGASTQLRGVIPDIVLPSVWNYSRDIGEDALENPLPWDTIPPARFEPINLLTPSELSELLLRSSARVATNQDFIYLREDIELFRKQQNEKTVSLNEQERLREREEARARQEARDKERRARPASNWKIYEITLKHADQPGLPPPLGKTNTLAAATQTGSAGGDPDALAANTLSATAPGDTADEEKPPPVDPVLEEAERILLDHIELLRRKSEVAAHP
ncbi:MAG: carboxy terminal-processing peptidase [Verrucomicrobiales bacterium]|nr:carboxy terminal-processing peptidase [Verrucomicrobiales bacterium]